MTNKVAFLVPSTTNKRDWKTIEDTYLWNILFKDLEEKTPTECDITVYVGYDSDDKIYHNMNERMKCNAIFKNFKIEWIDIIGNPCLMIERGSQHSSINLRKTTILGGRVDILIMMRSQLSF